VGASISVAAANAWLGIFPGLARVARPSAALLGLPLSTYTAALVANTAIPVWHESRRTLPFLFCAGAALSAGGAILAITPPPEARTARRVAFAGAVAEAAANEFMRSQLKEHAGPYTEGAAKRYGDLSRAGVTAGAALLAWRGRRSRAAAVVAGALLMGGALSARWSVYKAGFQGANDPRYVVGPQRSGIESGTRAGAARTQPRDLGAPVG